MPRIRPPKQQPIPEVIEDPTPPAEDVVIELSDDELDAMVPVEPQGEVEEAEGGAVEQPVERQEPQPDDAIRRAVEAQQRAEEMARQANLQRDEAIRRAQEHEVDLARERGERADAEYNAILTGIAAEETAIEKASADYETAAAVADWKAAGAANRELAVATARLDRLQLTKRDYDQARETNKNAPPQQPQQEVRRPASVEEEITAMAVPPEAKTWLRAHPEMLSDPAQREQLAAANEYIIKRRKLPQFSADYFDALDVEFGFKKPAAPVEPAKSAASQPAAQRRSMPVTAPVSRDVPTSSGQRQSSSQITLSAEEREIARNSFTDPTGKMTNAEKERLYAMNKAKLIRKRADGSYPSREQA